MFYMEQKAPTQVRTRCRNPRCAVQLKIPADNPRDAFCCRGCERAYYRSRCRVCERLFSRKTERRIVCGREKCRYECKRYPEQFFGARHPSSPIAHNASRSAHFTGLKSGTKSGRGSRVIAVDPAAQLIQRHTPPINLVGGHKFSNAPQLDPDLILAILEAEGTVR